MCTYTQNIIIICEHQLQININPPGEARKLNLMYQQSHSCTTYARRLSEAPSTIIGSSHFIAFTLIQTSSRINCSLLKETTFANITSTKTSHFDLPSTSVKVLMTVLTVLSSIKKIICHILTIRTYHYLQDECSFVSLRDVDRAMIVLKFFYEKLGVISPEMNQLAEKQHKRYIQVNNCSNC